MLDEIDLFEELGLNWLGVKDSRSCGARGLFFLRYFCSFFAEIGLNELGFAELRSYPTRASFLLE